MEGDGSTAEIITPSKIKIKEDENDIRYIKTGDLGLTKSTNYFFGSLSHYLIISFLLFAFILITLTYKKYLKNNSNVVFVKERKAAKLAKKQLFNAEKYMKLNHKEQFYNEIITALHNYLGNKFGLSTVDLSKEKIIEILIAKQVNQTTSNLAIETIDTCEFAKYAPNAVSDNLQQIYQNTIELISQIEEQIKK
jgi:hypothetical protein